MSISGEESIRPPNRHEKTMQNKELVAVVVYSLAENLKSHVSNGAPNVKRAIPGKHYE